MKEIDFFPKSYNPSDLSGIKILDVKEISFEPINGIRFTEVSDLAYEQGRGLFALSDKGYLYRLHLEIKEGKIDALELENAFRLRTKSGKRLEKKRRDSEGLAFAKEGLIVSFEGKPKVSLFDLQGQKIKNYPLPAVLEEINNYRKPNKALEAVVMHPKYGIITAPERPLKDEKEDTHTLYSLDKQWHFKADGEITAIETMPDGNLLVLERDFNFFAPRYTIRLKKVPITECSNSFCPAETLARLQSNKGWKLDNFEGLSRISDHQYLMISDDNDLFLQKCILLLFEVR